MSKIQDLLRLDSLDVIKGFLTNTDPELDYWFEAEMNHRDLDPTAHCCKWLEAQNVKGEGNKPVVRAERRSL